MIEFSAKFLPALYSFSAKNDIRYYLNETICIEPHKDGGSIIVSTNGHMIMFIRDKNAKCEKRTILKVNKNALRFCSSYSVASIDHNNHLYIKNGDIELYIQPGDCLTINKTGNFPNWLNLIPDFENLQSVMPDPINPSYIYKAMAAHPDFKKGASCVKFWQEATTKPLVIEYCKYPEIMVLIMPIRDDCVDIMQDWKTYFIGNQK